MHGDFFKVSLFVYDYIYKKPKIFIDALKMESEKVYIYIEMEYGIFIKEMWH